MTSSEFPVTRLVLLGILCCLSFFGSSFIIYHVICHTKGRQRRQSSENAKINPQKRIMCCLSGFDIIFTTALLLQPLMIPKSFVAPWAFGNKTTCNTVAFLQQLGFATPLYNAALSIYYLFRIKFRLQDKTFAKYVEPWIHLFCIGWPLAGAIFGLALDAYRETGTNSCFWNIRSYNSYFWVFAGGPILFSFAIILIDNIIVVTFVKRTILRVRRHSISIFREPAEQLRGESSGERSGERSSRISRRSSLNSTSQDDRIQAVFKQSLLYVGSFLVCYIPAIINYIVLAAGGRLGRTFRVYMMIFLPLQGFFNFYIYLRPIYKRYRDRFPNESRWWAFRSALWGERKTNNNRTARREHEPQTNESDFPSDPEVDIATTTVPDESSQSNIRSEKSDD